MRLPVISSGQSIVEVSAEFEFESKVSCHTDHVFWRLNFEISKMADKTFQTVWSHVKRMYHERLLETYCPAVNIVAEASEVSSTNLTAQIVE